MQRYVGRIWVAGLVVALAALVFFLRDSLTLGTMVSLSGVRLLGRIFESAAVQLRFQQGLFHFTDILLTAGLIAGGSASVHKLVTRIEDFLRTSRTRAPDG